VNFRRKILFASILLSVGFAFSSHARTLKDYGDDLRLIVPTWAFGLAMAEEGYTGMRQFLCSLVSSQGIVEWLKGVTHQPRPNGMGEDSFPSGHAAGAFTGAMFIHCRYSLRQALFPYWLSIFVAASRVDAQKHYPRDVIASFFISAVCTFFFVDDKNSSVEVMANGDTVGIVYKSSF
jgi:membrane-associated phospholipid phosphatase